MKKHEWVSLDGEVATVGITKHATEMLGDIVFVEVPDAGKAVEKEGQAAVVESTKAASDVYSPISGEITEGNKAIADDPGSVNTDPEGSSWFFFYLLFCMDVYSILYLYSSIYLIKSSKFKEIFLFTSLDSPILFIILLSILIIIPPAFPVTSIKSFW